MLAALLEVSEEKLCEIAWANTQKLFGLANVVAPKKE